MIKFRMIVAASGLALSIAGSTGVANADIEEELDSGTSSVYGLSEANQGPSIAPMIAVSADYFNCVLYPSTVHLRTSGNKETVGAKPYTKCTEGTPSLITHSSTLYKARWLGLNWESMVTKKQKGTNTRNLTLKTVSWACKNANSSKFFQQTSGTSVQRGRTFSSLVRSKEAKLSCGN